MKSKLVLLLSILVYSTKLFSQAAPLVQVTIPNPNPVCNPSDCTQLQANYNTIKQTNDYAVSSIIYNPNFPFTGGTVIEATSDDNWTEIINLPFTFCFYGQSYNQLLVGTNGVITFNTTGPNYTPGGPCRWAYNATIPNADANFIRNAIFGVYQDTNILPGALNADTTPNNIQNVNYYVLDTGPNAAPNRVFVANFNELPQFSCNATVGLQTSQIIIYETTNIIDVLISKRTSCTGWNSGSGLVGIQNATGTLTRVPPLRNTGTWSATNEAWRFTPNGAATVPSSIQWFQADGVTPAAAVNVNPLTVCPAGPETYIAKVTYTICNGQPTVVQKAVNVDVSQLPVNNPVDLVFCSSALQYVKDWKKLIKEFAATGASKILLSDVFCGNFINSFVTIQNYYESKIPHWFFSTSELIIEFNKYGYELILQTEATGKRAGIDDFLPMSNFPTSHQLHTTSHLLFSKVRVS